MANELARIAARGDFREPLTKAHGHAISSQTQPTNTGAPAMLGVTEGTTNLPETRHLASGPARLCHGWNGRPRHSTPYSSNTEVAGIAAGLQRPPSCTENDGQVRNHRLRRTSRLTDQSGGSCWISEFPVHTVAAIAHQETALDVPLEVVGQNWTVLPYCLNRSLDVV